MNECNTKTEYIRYSEPYTTVLKVCKLRDDAFLPEFAHKGDSGFSMRIPDDHTIYPGEWKLIGIGLLYVPEYGYEVQVRSRSGMTLNNGLIVAQGTGTIDNNYRGEVGVIVYNRSENAIKLKRGDNIAQGVLCELPDVIITEISMDEVDETSRGSGGYGSTGK